MVNKPFLMFGSLLFFTVIYKTLVSADLAREYVVGAVLLGLLHVLLWYLFGANLQGDPAHTLVQVSVNNLVIIIYCSNSDLC